ncbi:hypothetical protein KAT80_01340 [Candidatus Pacearchaeota archaeon]|nr:hypothetical protein [Candidatus Pacearchaeota archaeon]
MSTEIIECGNLRENPLIFQKWKQEEIQDYQEIGERELEPFYIYTLKKIFSKDYASQFQKWSWEKIQEYQETIKELELIYAANEIPRSNPESRMKYVTNVLEKIGYGFGKDSSNALAEREGKAKALVLLEDVFLIEKSSFNRFMVIK